MLTLLLSIRAETGLCGVLPSETAERSDEVENITLVPMGAARLRISAFPQACPNAKHACGNANHECKNAKQACPNAKKTCSNNEQACANNEHACPNK